MQTHGRPRDEGTSLVEVIVALGITATVLLALLSSAVFALGSTVTARQEQQAADYLNEVLEQARALEYASLTMSSGQAAAAAGVATVGSVRYFKPDPAATAAPPTAPAWEPLSTSPTGLVVPHVDVRTTTNGVYTLRRWVTVPTTATLDAYGQPSLRRVTAEVSWTTRGGTATRRSSTLLTHTRRGLPLPAFTWAYTGPAVVVDDVPTWVKNPGNDVDYGFVLQNQGARDTWTLSASTPGWTWYLDSDRDGLWSQDASEPPLAGGSTGPVEPGAQPVNVVAFRSTTASESGTSTTVFTATPASDPTVRKSVTTRLSVQTGAITPPTASAAPSPTSSAPAATCTGGSSGTTSSGAVLTATAPSTYTLQSLTLAKAAPGSALGDAPATASTVMTRDATVLEPALCNWSTNLQTGAAGRYLATAASPASVATQTEWRFQPANKRQDAYEGTATVTLWVQCPSGTPAVTLSLLSLSGTTSTSRATTTLSTPGCSPTTFTRYSVALGPLPAFTIALTDSLVLRATASAPVRLGYGAQSVPAVLQIGMK